MEPFIDGESLEGESLAAFLGVEGRGELVRSLEALWECSGFGGASGGGYGEMDRAEVEAV